jgi:hypothetical protein
LSTAFTAYCAVKTLMVRSQISALYGHVITGNSVRGNP